MMKKVIQTTRTPHIIVEVSGDLAIRTGSPIDITLKGDEAEVVEQEGGYQINGTGSLKLFVPPESSISVKHTGGDTAIKNIQGVVSVHDVNGDLILSNTGQTKITTVHGDLSAKNINGSLSFETIHGDVVMRNINGDVHGDVIHGELSIRHASGATQIEAVHGDASVYSANGDFTLEHGARDVNLRNLSGLCKVGQADGDIRIVGTLTSGEHHFTAQGDIVLRWPDGESVNLVGTASQLINKLSLTHIVESETGFVGSIGEGKVHVNLTAQGRVILKPLRNFRQEWDDFRGGEGVEFEFDFGQFGEQISSQIDEQLSRLSVDFETQFGPEFSEKIAEKVNRKAEQAMRKAERAIRQIEQRMQRMTERQSRHAPKPPPAPKAPVAPEGKVSHEEQLKILKMVEQGTITPQEAALLLDALRKN